MSKIYELKFNSDEFKTLLSAICNEIVDCKRKYEETNEIYYHTGQKEYENLLYHLELVSRYQGDEDDRTN